MNLSRLRLITFDVTNTLLQFRSSPGKQYGEIGAMYGVLCDDKNLSANFKSHWQKMNQEHPNFGLKSGLGWEKWWKMIVAGTFKDSKFNLEDKKLDAISSHLINAYKTSLCWQQCYGAFGLLSYLRNMGVPLGVISNFDPRLHELLVNTKLRHYFKFVITSYEVGVEKPEREIFDKAMEAAMVEKIKPEDCLHVGDKMNLDYLAAKNCGWNAVLVRDKTHKQMKDKYPEFQEDFFFSSLYDLHKHMLEANCNANAWSSL